MKNPSGQVVSKNHANALGAPAPIVTHREVLQWTHPKDGYASGHEWDPVYYHITTPDKARNGVMYTYLLEGYSYGIGMPLSATWVGYLYGDAVDAKDAIVNHYARVMLPLPSDLQTSGAPEVKASQYIGADGFLHLVIGPMKRYYNSFVLSYRSGSTGDREGNSHVAGRYVCKEFNDDVPK